MKLFLNRVINSIFLVIVLLLCIAMKNSSGSSSVYAEIKPISINKKGEILCKTRFTKNETGGHVSTRIEYGFSIISNDTIIEFKTKIIEPPEEYEFYFEQKKHLDSIFRSKTNQQQLEEITDVILKKEYRFLSSNIESYKVDKVLSISDFETTRNISLENNQQKGLYGASSVEYYNEKKVHLLYDFGEILIFNNCNNIYDEEFKLGIELGANFDYYNPSNISNNNGENKSLGFGISKVTGVLIIK